MKQQWWNNYDWKMLANACIGFVIAVLLFFLVSSCSDQEDREEDQGQAEFLLPSGELLGYMVGYPVYVPTEEI